MIFLGKNACNRIIFITFAVKCISSTRRFAENPSEFSLLREDLKAFQLDYNLLREDLFLCKTKSQFEITKKGATATPHFVFRYYSSFRILRLALSITSVFKEAR